MEGNAGRAVVLYGRHPVLEALRGGTRPIDEILLDHEAEARLGPIVGLARRAGIRCVRAPRAALAALAGTLHHQGVVARVAAQAYASLEAVLARPRTRGEAGWVIVLDRVQDPGNVGNLLRTAEALGAHGAVVLRHQAAGLTTHAVRAAAGALEHLPVARVGNLVQTLQLLKREGYWIVGAVAAPLEGGTAPVAPWELDLRGATALVLGSEGRGLRPLVAGTCDVLTRVPLSGRLDSLNVAAAGAVLLYEVARQRRGEKLFDNGP